MPPDAPPGRNLEHDLVGETLGHFKIVARLGEGGMGIVYRALDEKLRRTVALKVLPPAAAGDEERRSRFLREARSAAAVTHANIATIYEVGEEGGRAFIAMELVDGANLRARLDRGPLPLDEALHISRGIARGLAEAHRAGVVHRDLKPENVVITVGGDVKVLDFGLAKLPTAVDATPVSGDHATETASHATAEGRILGTPAYMSPEQARGLAVDARSDVFSFGVVLFELVTGKRPFTGATTLDLLSAVMRDPPPVPSSLTPGLPPAIDRLIARALEKEPAKRHPDCGALLADLEALGTASAEALAAPAPRVRVRPLVAASLALLLAGGAAAALLLHKPAPTPAAAPVAAKPVPITDLPRPQNLKPEALSEYDAGIQILRNGVWGSAHGHFKRAAELEPTFAQAHLRLALTSPFNETPSTVHALYRQAVTLRGTLSERDSLFLDALEPELLREPSDPLESARRFGEASRRFPMDAELAAQQAFRLADAARQEESLAASRRATELDPKHADAWQMQGKVLRRLGRYAEARQAIDRCVAEVPTASECVIERVWIDEDEGRCDEAEKDARLSMLGSASVTGYITLAREMYATGKPLEAVRSTMNQAVDAAPEPFRPMLREQGELVLAVHAGEFTRALALTEAYDRAHAADPNHGVRALSYAYRIMIQREIGRIDQAARTAEEYLNRRDGWVISTVGPIRDDMSLWALRTRLAAGAIRPEAYAAARRAFLERWRPSPSNSPGLLWLLAYAEPAETREDALEAIAAMPSEPFHEGVGESRGTGFEQGKVLLLVGRVDEALPLLERGANSCTLLHDAFRVTRFHDDLGRAREAKGDKPAACAAYRWIIDRWGHAKPKSLTADHARARSTALGCP